ncbi:putative dihydrouridine synthase [Trypanosoma grayi]|uniref:putative dihydrouridine synthase n=1 Tax=Trypanosoma grayi TaxID=71804 RepID=UPI0004F492BF|nr:putative dihydrouridine synthase [Trypanosoma grayi]KEG14213.1 putative dihydrouridine synthase [Trypanosoma grayi]
MLAPMVRVGSVGFRIFCAAHGADVVFSEEVVAAKLVRCCREVRVCDESVGPMVEFVAYEPFKQKYKRSVAFSTPLRSAADRAGEGAPVVLQLGVSSPEMGVAAALQCCEDVDGIDVNMGCPKKFSVANGMGAALMRDTARAASILVAIDAAVNAPERVAVRGRRVPVSFKTRLLETAETTAQMILSVMEKVGPNRVHAITLHARTTTQTSETPPLYDRAAATVKLLRAHPLLERMCFVLNGSVTCRADGAIKMTKFGFDSVMIARHAMWDMSVFSHQEQPEGCVVSNEVGETPLASASWLELYRDLLRYQVKYQTPFMYVKYHLTRSIPCISAMKHLMTAIQQETSCYEDVAKVLGFPTEEQLGMRDAAPMELVSCIPEGSFHTNDVCHANCDATNTVQGCSEVTAAAPVLKKSRKE